jgi:hypothetical protein
MCQSMIAIYCFFDDLLKVIQYNEDCRAIDYDGL